MRLNLSRRQFLSASTLVPIAGSVICTPALAWTMTPSLADNLVPRAAKWLVDNFGATIREKVAGSEFTTSLACAIACQESGYAWYTRKLRDKYSAAQILRLMVLDNNTPRGVFPRDTDAFLADARFRDLAPGLIAASDASRTARGQPASGKLYYGYGIFQYDLQNILDDEDFWRTAASAGTPGDPVQGLWGDIGMCMDRLLKELNRKRQRHPDSMQQTIRAYNGSGPNAEAYATIVMRFERLIRTCGIA
jgi:hypothetical protein